MSAQGFTQTILTPSGGGLTGNTGLLANLSLKDVDPETGDLLGNSYPATSHIGNGQYAFGNIPYACYKLYNNSTPVPGFHGDGVKGRWIGASSFSASIITSGTLDVARLPDEIPATNIADGTVTDTEFECLNGVDSNIQDQLDTKARLSGSTQEISAPTIFTGQRPGRDDGIATGSYSAVTDFVSFDDMLEALSTVSVTPYQQASKIRRIISGGTVETNKVYTSIPTAISSCSSPSVYNSFDILLEQGQVVGTTTDNVFYLNHSSVTNHCHLRGKGRKTKLILGGAGQSGTSIKTVTIENCTVYMGANDITDDRIYNGYEFINCMIYSYKNLTLTGCKLFNCQVKQPSTFGVTIDGTSEVEGCTFTNFVTTALAGLSYSDGLNTNYTMPTDLSLGV